MSDDNAKISAPKVNPKSNEYRLLVEEKTRLRDDLRLELEAFMEDGTKKDRSDFLRGRIFELNELINRKE